MALSSYPLPFDRLPPVWWCRFPGTCQQPADQLPRLHDPNLSTPADIEADTTDKCYSRDGVAKRQRTAPSRTSFTILLLSAVIGYASALAIANYDAEHPRRASSWVAIMENTWSPYTNVDDNNVISDNVLLQALVWGITALSRPSAISFMLAVYTYIGVILAYLPWQSQHELNHCSSTMGLASTGLLVAGLLGGADLQAVLLELLPAGLLTALFFDVLARHLRRMQQLPKQAEK